MARAGHIKAIKAKGKTFFYIRQSYRNDKGKPTSRNIFALGQEEKALALLADWLEDPAQKPEELVQFKEEDLLKWIDYINAKNAN